MAQKSGNDGSVAPKERVNIIYRSSTGDAQEEVELPLRFLVMGDFTGRADDTPLEQRAPINVDKDNFDEVLAAHKVNLQLSVPNKLSEEPGAELSVSLNFEKMRDFNPDNICQQVPELRSLLDLREALTALKGPMGNVPAFRRRLQAILDDPEAQKRLMAELNLVLDNEEK